MTWSDELYRIYDLSPGQFGADQGIGVSPEMQERIFQPFERAVSIRHYGGLGLGLFIVRNIVQGLGGKVYVESAPDSGSTFIVELPQSRPT